MILVAFCLFGLALFLAGYGAGRCSERMDQRWRDLDERDAKVVRLRPRPAAPRCHVTLRRPDAARSVHDPKGAA